MRMPPRRAAPVRSVSQSTLFRVRAEHYVVDPSAALLTDTAVIAMRVADNIAAQNAIVGRRQNRSRESRITVGQCLARDQRPSILMYKSERRITRSRLVASAVDTTINISRDDTAPLHVDINSAHVCSAGVARH